MIKWVVSSLPFPRPRPNSLVGLNGGLMQSSLLPLPNIDMLWYPLAVLVCAYFGQPVCQHHHQSFSFSLVAQIIGEFTLHTSLGNLMPGFFPSLFFLQSVYLPGSPIQSPNHIWPDFIFCSLPSIFFLFLFYFRYIFFRHCIKLIINKFSRLESRIRHLVPSLRQPPTFWPPHPLPGILCS